LSLVHFAEEDWERIQQDWAAWWVGELGRPAVIIEGIGPAVEEAAHAFASSYPLEMPADQVLERYEAELEAKRFYGDAWPKWWPNCGPGIVAGFLGARVHAVPETVWFEPAEELCITALHPEYDADNLWWRRVRELTHEAVERWGGLVSVGHTDLGGNLDTVASLRTTRQLLLDLHDAPGEVARLGAEITRLWLRYYEELCEIVEPAGRGTTPWAPIWSPGRCYMLQCDFSCMISPEMFGRYVMPDLAACCEALDHSFYHLDGKGAVRHLDLLLSLERLGGIQWIPGEGAPPPEQWLPLLKRIRDAGKLCQVFVGPEGALTIARELGGRGFAFAIARQMSAAEAEDFLRELMAADAGPR
jgi:5-methyltetrahydrofolate--homocysteine methyltransferase